VNEVIEASFKGLAVPTREKILALEAQMMALPKEHHIPADNAHAFCPGVYARSIYMKAGTLVTSRIHKTQHFFAVLKGSCTVVNTHGERELIEAPYLGVTMPGTKRVLLIHEDVIWTTFHATDMTNVEEIEKAITSETFDAYDEEFKL
jgi:hypothetical protein